MCELEKVVESQRELINAYESEFQRMKERIKKLEHKIDVVRDLVNDGECRWCVGTDAYNKLIEITETN